MSPGGLADSAGMRALSVRQPYAEMILRGIKTAEYRSRPTRLIGERFYLYASKTAAAFAPATPVWSGDLVVGRPPAWMTELAGQLKLFGATDGLPRGVIVGSAVIDRVTPHADGLWRWHLAGVERLKTPKAPTGHPQPVWFRPF